MKKLNSAIITLAAVMSMSASAMAAPLCTNNLSTSVLACTSSSANCDINSILESNCSSAMKDKVQYFTNLGCLSGNIQTQKSNCVGNNCGLTKATTAKTTIAKDTTAKATTAKATTAKATTAKATTCKVNTTTAPTTAAPTTTAPTTKAPTTKAPTTTAPTTTAPTTTAPTTTAPTTTAPTTTAPTTTNTNTSVSSYAQEVVNLVNAERAKEGLSALSIDTKVTAAAQVRATEIKTSFSHTRPDGRSCFTALAEAGASYSGAGENIAIGQKTPSEVVTAWMNSPGHRANIMKANFKYIGIGINGTAWAQLFTY